VDGEDMGPNLLPDAFFDRWTDPNTPTDYTITKTGSSGIISRTTTRLTGQYGLRWDNNTTPTTLTRGFQIHLPDLIDQCKGHWVTVGAWMYVPVNASNEPWYRIHLGTTPSAVQADVDYLPYPVASHAAKANKWVFFSHSTYVDPTTTDLWIQVNTINDQSGAEWFILDRMAVVLGKTAQNVPFHIGTAA